VAAATVEGNLSRAAVQEEAKLMIRRAIALMGVLLACQAASAELLTPIQQNRYVSAQASYSVYGEVMDSDQQVISAPDFGPFSATATADVAGGAAGASGLADQASQILGESIHANAYLSMGAWGFVGETWGVGQADSYAQFSFSVSEPLPYSLSGWLSLHPDASAHTGGAVFVELQGPDGFELLRIELPATPESTEVPLAVNGTLLPGTYALTASGHVWADEHYDLADINGGFSLDFAVTPEPATLLTVILAALAFCRRPLRPVGAH
jgi:hypothetical protein